MTDNPQWQPGQHPPPPPGGTGEDWQSQAPQAGQANQPGGGWQSEQQQAAYQQQQGWQGQPQAAYQGQQVAGDERTWMILAHLSAPIAMILSAGWLSILGPLIVWALKKDTSPSVRQAAAGAFNFNLSFWLMTVVGWICAITLILLPVAIIIWIIVFITAAYAHLRGAWLASKGQIYTYPFQVRVLS